jgi:methylated-DNA-[protein]-cysteine S-methyltransferase
MTRLSAKTIASPVGQLRLVAHDTALVAILWERDDPARVPLAPRIENAAHPVLVEAARQLDDYFAGRRTHFTVPLDFRGTEFQRAVWQALLTIPFGETRS